MRTIIRVLVAGLLVATPALAEDTQKAAVSKPAPALTEAFKDMSGTWSCSGSMDNPRAPGTQVKTKTEMRISPTVDGFAYTGVWKSEKNAAMPAGGKGTMQWGFDSGRTSWSRPASTTWAAPGWAPPTVRRTARRCGPRRAR